jgi:hypothetical protein
MLHLKTVLRLKNKTTSLVKAIVCSDIEDHTVFLIPCWNGKNLVWADCPEPYLKVASPTASLVEFPSFHQIVLHPSSLLCFPPPLLQSTATLNSVGLLRSNQLTPEVLAYDWVTDSLKSVTPVKTTNSSNRPLISAVSLITYPYRNIVLDNGLLLSV